MDQSKLRSQVVLSFSIKITRVLWLFAMRDKARMSDCSDQNYQFLFCLLSAWLSEKLLGISKAKYGNPVPARKGSEPKTSPLSLDDFSSSEGSKTELVIVQLARQEMRQYESKNGFHAEVNALFARHRRG